MTKAASFRMLSTVNLITSMQMIHPNEYWTPQPPSVCLRGVTRKHCQFCSCCVCAGLRTTWFWQESRGSLAVGGEYCNLDQGMQLVQLVTQKAKSKEALKPVSFPNYLGSRVKFQWIWFVCSSCCATGAWGAFDLVLILHVWAWVGPSKVIQWYSSASKVVPGMHKGLPNSHCWVALCRAVEKLRFLMELELPPNERSPVTAKLEIAN